MNSSDAAKIIIEEVTQFQEEMAKRGEYFGGLKIIYCASRSANLSDVEVALAECLEFKKRWPDWIAGTLTIFKQTPGR
jgi:adenosine deaminase CECR1